MEILWSSKKNTSLELEALREVLDTKEDGNGQMIIAFADNRYWKGGHCNYRIVETGNLKDCLFTNHDDTEFLLSDHGEFLSREYGKEGSCQYYFRQAKEGLPKNFLTLMSQSFKDGTFGNGFINYYTEPLGDYVRACLKKGGE